MEEKLLYLAEKKNLLHVAAGGGSQNEHSLQGHGVIISEVAGKMVVTAATSTPTGSADKEYVLGDDPICLITLDQEDELCIIGIGDIDVARANNNPDIRIVVNTHTIGNGNTLQVKEENGKWKVWEL